MISPRKARLFASFLSAGPQDAKLSSSRGSNEPVSSISTRSPRSIASVVSVGITRGIRPPPRLSRRITPGFEPPWHALRGEDRHLTDGRLPVAPPRQQGREDTAQEN